MDKEWITVSALIGRETPKALLLDFIYCGKRVQGWVPRSHAKTLEKHRSLKFRQLLSLTRWVCETKFREQYGATPVESPVVYEVSAVTPPSDPEDDDVKYPIMLTCRSCGIERKPGILFCEVCLEPWVKLKS